MDFLFGARKTPAERIKEYNRQIKRSVRELERERMGLERQEKKLMSDIKKAAKDGQIDSAKIMAKDLVRTRGYIKKMYKMKSHMEAVSLRLQTMQSSAQMAQCMKGVTKVMGRMNKKMNLPQISKIMQEFEKQNEMMGAAAMTCTMQPLEGQSMRDTHK
uniref:Charged multivesicular body protein 2a n=1 Tax=Calcidiscus leptoporus TaxID=127549 RepID=A0A7S0J2V3_9EUKA|mmetsp:Transcript_36245/g.84707  ORF Transcript_36245/g.84707 Transcript_36245/m.84707 type:complete len:159 (+) Transcript_36245:92-568(+)